MSIQTTQIIDSQATQPIESQSEKSDQSIKSDPYDSIEVSFPTREQLSGDSWEDEVEDEVEESESDDEEVNIVMDLKESDMINKICKESSEIKEQVEETEEEILKRNPLWRTKPCNNVRLLANGSYAVCRRKWCSFAHSLEELRVAECRYGTDCYHQRCMFQHPRETIQRYYKRTGKLLPQLPDKTEKTVKHLPSKKHLPTDRFTELARVAPSLKTLMVQFTKRGDHCDHYIIPKLVEVLEGKSPISSLKELIQLYTE